MKKRVVVIYTGQMRMNALGLTPRDNVVVDSINKYFLNFEFKEKYEYDIFISTDKIDVHKATNFFGSHLINIAIESGQTLHPTFRETIPSYEILFNHFIQRDFYGLNPYAEQYYQYYRAYRAYEMVRGYQSVTGTKYDYFIKLRPDIIIQKSLMPIFEGLDLGKKAFMEHNLLEAASFEIFDLFYNLAHHYGAYHQSKGDGRNNHNEYPNYCPMDCNTIKFSSEMQVTNCIYDMLESRKYSPTKHFFGSVYNGHTGSSHTYTLLHR